MAIQWKAWRQSQKTLEPWGEGPRVRDFWGAGHQVQRLMPDLPVSLSRLE